MDKISGVIITFNEEKNIERCIKSILPICDDVIVIDSFSTDKTKEICTSLSVRFIEHPFKGHIEQKNFAIEQAQNDYVLSIDGDECLDTRLTQELIKAKSNLTADGYTFNRLTNYSGHWVKHCGWYPDTKLRLWRKSKGNWQGLNPHDIVRLSARSTIKHIQGDLLHFSYDSISDHVTQTNKFTTIAAKAAFSSGIRSNLFKIYTRPLLKFFRDYFFKLGFLDGRYGFVICYINSLSALLKYAKIKELQDGKEI